jgi:hypothetical protein
MKMEAVCSSETLVYFYQTIWHHIPENNILQEFHNLYSSTNIIRWSNKGKGDGWGIWHRWER